MNDRLAELRDAFDQPFTRAAEDGTHDPDEQLLLIDAGGLLLALAVREAGGVHACPPITPLPSRSPALLGLVGLNGAMVAVHGLAKLLDPTGSAVASAAPRFLVTHGADRSTAFGFDVLVGLARAPRTAVASGLVAIGTERRTVIRLEQVAEAARGRTDLGQE